MVLLDNSYVLEHNMLMCSTAVLNETPELKWPIVSLIQIDCLLAGWLLCNLPRLWTSFTIILFWTHTISNLFKSDQGNRKKSVNHLNTLMSFINMKSNWSQEAKEEKCSVTLYFPLSWVNTGWALLFFFPKEISALPVVIAEREMWAWW